MLGRRALPGGRRTHLGATRDSHPGLLEALRTRRRRAQIAARHALEGTTPPPRVSATRPKAS